MRIPGSRLGSSVVRSEVVKGISDRSARSGSITPSAAYCTVGVRQDAPPRSLLAECPVNSATVACVATVRCNNAWLAAVCYNGQEQQSSGHGPCQAGIPQIVKLGPVHASVDECADDAPVQ